jgi:phosphatidate cytidylyltransferase
VIVHILIIILSVLFLGAMIIWAGSKKIDNPPLFTTLWIKYFTTLVVIGVMVIPALSGAIFFTAMVIILALLTQNELLRLSLPDLAMAGKIVVLTAGGLILWAGFTWGITGLAAGLMGAAAVFLLIHCVIHRESRGWQIYTQALTTLVYPVGFWGFYLLTWQLENGPVLLVFFYCVTEANNAFSQLAGSLAGKTKMFSSVSPNKTWEGALGGAAAAVAMGLAINGLVLGFHWGDALAGIVLIIVGAVAGDLIASRIKRSFDVKDFGRVLPENGGVMDILDSLIFTSPFFFWFAAYHLGLLR